MMSLVGVEPSNGLNVDTNSPEPGTARTKKGVEADIIISYVQATGRVALTVFIFNHVLNFLSIYFVQMVYYLQRPFSGPRGVVTV